MAIALAMDRGYFREEGLELEITRFPTASEMTAPLAAGQLDIGLGGISAGLFNSMAQGLPLKIVADRVANMPDSQSTVWMVRGELLDKGLVGEARDLRGLTIALGGAGTIVQVELERILQMGGLTADDVIVQQIPYPDQIAAFANQRIDVAYVFEPFRTRLLEQGTARVWRTAHEIIPYHESTVVVFGPSMGHKREAGERWMVANLRGVREGLELIVERRDPQAIAIAAEYSTIKDPALWQKMDIQRSNPDGYNYPDSIRLDLNWFVANGLVTKPIDVDSVLDQSYVDYAIARLGPYRPGCGPNICR